MMPGDIDLDTLRVFRFVRDYHRQQGIPPSQREIGSGTFMSPSTVIQHIIRLEVKGWVIRGFNIPRSIRICEKAPTDSEIDRMWDAFINELDTTDPADID